MIIRFRKPGRDGFTRDAEMPAAPREGDEIVFSREVMYLHTGVADEGQFQINVVQWTPDDPDFSAYVVLR